MKNYAIEIEVSPALLVIIAAVIAAGTYFGGCW